MRTFVIIAMVLMAAVGTARAQTTEPSNQVENKELKKSYLYTWTDDKGVEHITDELGKVPQKYRSKAKQSEARKKGEAAEGQQGREEISRPSGHPNEEGMEEGRKAAWQQRMKEARQRLADAEQRYKELEQKRVEALGRWGGPASGQVEGRMEAERIEQEMKRAQQEIDDARNRIEVVIPDEARKAGVPPGWLRE